MSRTEEQTAATGADPAVAPRQNRWRQDIEGLRALAVGLVIAAHAGIDRLAGGFVGVDVFFVISGFLITGLLLREIRKNGRIDLSRFYARRVARLLPAAALVLAATLAASWIWLTPLRLKDIAADIVAAALNVVNFRLAVTGTDYLNADAEPSPVQHFWSLAVEEQYYIVWPLLLTAVVWLVLRRRTGENALDGAAPTSRRTARLTWTVTAILGTVLVASLAASVLTTPGDPVWAYFGLHTRAWELAAGALLAVAADRIRLGERTAGLLGWAGLALIAFTAFAYDSDTAFPGHAALLPVLGAVAVIAAGGRDSKWAPTWLLTLAPARYVGKISYGLYLWHWPVLMIAPTALGIEPTTRNNVALMGLAFVLAAVSFHAMEDPIRRHRPLTLVPSRSLVMGGALATSTLVIAFLAVTVPVVGTDKDLSDQRTMPLTEAVDVEYVPASLTPSLDDARDDKPTVYAEDCIVWQKDSEVNEDCWFGDEDGDRTVVIFGDSHAAQWFPPLEQIAEDNGWRLAVQTKAACAVPEVRETNEKVGGEFTQCREWRQSALDYIDDLEPDLVVTSASDDKDLLADDAGQAWLEGWEETNERLMDATGGHVVQIGSTPVWEKNIPNCLSENVDEATDCVFDLADSKLDVNNREEVLDQSSEQGVQVIDPLPWLCDIDSRRCPVIVGDLLVYRDSNHLTTYYTSALESELAAALPLPKTWDSERP
ncbi:acyltransferase family protein [Salininema proteolyticum]|uniref:Acyltransferase family protein n=1 Tax=Salininema proteolyticum TaxID=1607685 RepID=A0ABV8TSH8_9ACTN